MIWVLGYLIGIILYVVVVLAFTGFDCDDDETALLFAVMWPLPLIGYFILCFIVLILVIITEIEKRKKNE